MLVPNTFSHICEYGAETFTISISLISYGIEPKLQVLCDLIFIVVMSTPFYILRIDLQCSRESIDTSLGIR